jgi:hypothetical protein
MLLIILFYYYYYYFFFGGGGGGDLEGQLPILKKKGESTFFMFHCVFFNSNT